LKPARKRELVVELRRKYGASIRQAYGAMMISRSPFHCRSAAVAQTSLRNRIKEISAARVRYGYKQIYVVLRREGWRCSSAAHYAIAPRHIDRRAKPPWRSTSAGPWILSAATCTTAVSCAH
jgi:putative transposase